MKLPVCNSPQIYIVTHGSSVDQLFNKVSQIAHHLLHKVVNATSTLIGVEGGE